MNKREIIAELRRRAIEDADPWLGVGVQAFDMASSWKCYGDPPMIDAHKDDLRTFFLLVAYALEDEC